MNAKEILDHLSLRMPLTWIVSQEPARVVDHIATNEMGRSCYRFDVLRGLLTYDQDKHDWVNVLTEDEETGGFRTIVEKSEAFLWLIHNSEGGICAIQAVPETVEGLIDLFYSTLSSYRTAFYKSNPDKLPPQFVFVTYSDEVHPALERVVSKIDHDLPDREEISELLEHFSEGGINFVDDDSANVEAALGLSENEIISTVLVNARQNKASVTAPLIRSKKREILKNSGILEVRTPNLGLDDLGGLDEAKKLISSIKWMWQNPEETRELGLEPLRRLMMIGVPGVGKSLFCESIASALGVDLGKGGVSSSMNKFVGQSEANMRRTFATLRQMAPIVFWIDEFGRDMSGSASSSQVDGGTTDRVHGEFLTGIQELPENIFLAAAANRIEDLPPEMLRADRFDRIMFVGFPTLEERIDIFKICLGKKFELYNLEDLASNTPYFTGAEIKSLIKETRFDIGTTEYRAPNTTDLLNQIPNVRGRVWDNHRDAIINMYERAQIEWHWASNDQMTESDQVLRDAKKPPARHKRGHRNIPKPGVDTPSKAMKFTSH